MRLGRLSMAVLCFAIFQASCAEIAFSEKPAAAAKEGVTRITFALAAPSDVEVAILDAGEKVVRHLAAGVLGGGNPPPLPLKQGLRQELDWDGKNDFGKPAGAGPFKVRVRAGLGVRLGRFIGANPLAMGGTTGAATDPQGNVYVMSLSSAAAGFKQIVRLDSEGRYQRTVLPFAADLPAEHVSAWARYDGKLRPLNRNAAGPEFYLARSFYYDPVLSLLPVNDGKRLYLTDGMALYNIGYDGGMVEGKYELGKLWGKKAIPNSGDGPIHLAPSPDGRYLYLAGPFSCDTKAGHKADADFPPGRVYRMEIGKSTLEPFATLPVSGTFDGYRWTGKHIKVPQHYTVPHGPLHGIAVNKDGLVFVADQDQGRVVVLDAAGKQISELQVACPDMLAIHPRTGALYVLTKEIEGYYHYKLGLVKFVPDGGVWKTTAPAASLDLGSTDRGTPGLTLSAGNGDAILWVSGLKEGLTRITDKDNQWSRADLAGAGKNEVRIADADRFSVDPETDDLYINNAYSETRRFNGQTGEGGEIIRPDKKGVLEVTVGRDGYIYALMEPFSGSLGRFTRDLKPASYAETGTHLLSPYIYGAAKPLVGYRDRGIGVGWDGKVYMNWMSSGWCLYGVTVWGPNGKPINGARAQVAPEHYKSGLPAEMRQALIAPLGVRDYGGMYAGACVRVDSRNRVYVGIGVQPKGTPKPAGFENDPAYEGINGSIVRFLPQGGGWGREYGGKELYGKDEVWFEPAPRPADALEANKGNYFLGADKIYGGFGPMSSKHGDVAEPLGHSCSCRGGRFEIDWFDRLLIPNPVTNSVRICDNNDNLICEFGAYGNFDSQWVPADSKDGKPLVAIPEIPLGWPVGVGYSEKSIYVADMYNRRMVRVDRKYAAEETCAVK